MHIIQSQFNIGDKVEFKDRPFTAEVTGLDIRKDCIFLQVLDSIGNKLYLPESMFELVKDESIYVVVAEGGDDYLVWETEVEGATKERAIKNAKNLSHKYRTRIAKLVFIEED